MEPSTRSPVWRASLASGRGEAASRGNYMPLVTERSLVPAPGPCQQKANSLCVIFEMIHPTVRGALASPPAHEPPRPPDLLQFTLAAQIRYPAAALHLLNCVVMSSCGEALGRHLGSWGGAVFPAEFSDSEVRHTSQECLREQHRLENKEE